MEQSNVLGPYLQGDRIVAIPRRRAPRLALLDLLANQFEPGRRYSENDVTVVLTRYHPDVCSLRRYLVDEGLMERSQGLYWRAGGTFDVG